MRHLQIGKGAAKGIFQLGNCFWQSIAAVVEVVINLPNRSEYPQKESSDLATSLEKSLIRGDEMANWQFRCHSAKIGLKVVMI